MFYHSPGYQNIDISVPQITYKSTLDSNIAAKQHPGYQYSSPAAPRLADIADMAAKQPPSNLSLVAREAHWPLKLVPPVLTCPPKIDHFGTWTP